MIYLCGPINGRSDADCKDWRAVATELLRVVKDPMARDYRGRETDPGIASEIVENDKADILDCKALLVYFDRPSVGTSMEILFAWDRGMPVHVVNASDKPLSPWLIYHATKVHQTIQDACRALS